MDFLAAPVCVYLSRTVHIIRAVNSMTTRVYIILNWDSEERLHFHRARRFRRKIKSTTSYFNERKVIFFVNLFTVTRPVIYAINENQGRTAVSQRRFHPSKWITYSIDELYITKITQLSFFYWKVDRFTKGFDQSTRWLNQKGIEWFWVGKRGRFLVVSCR